MTTQPSDTDPRLDAAAHVVGRAVNRHTENGIHSIGHGCTRTCLNLALSNRYHRDFGRDAIVVRAIELGLVDYDTARKEFTPGPVEPQPAWTVTPNHAPFDDAMRGRT